MCDNETWLAAYLDRSLAEPERREYEMHISHCPRCLAELIAAKADLDEVLGEAAVDARRERLAASSASKTVPARAAFGAPRMFSLFAPRRDSAGVASATLASVAASLVIVGGFFALMLSPRWDQNVIAGKTYVTRLLATTDIGDMRLSGSPMVRPAREIVYRGGDESSTHLFKLGLQVLASAKDTYGGVPPICDLLGDLYLANGDIGLAEASYREALRADESDPGALNGLAVAAYRRGDTAEARVYLDRAVGSGRAGADVFYNLAHIAKLAGNMNEYKRFLTGCLEKDSSSPLAERVRRMLNE